MSFPFEAVSVYAFDAANEQELSTTEGERLVVKGEEEGGWYVCCNAAGLTGYVPKTYLENKSPVTEQVPAAKKRSRPDKPAPTIAGQEAVKSVTRRSSKKNLDSESPKTKKNKDKKREKRSTIKSSSETIDNQEQEAPKEPKKLPEETASSQASSETVSTPSTSLPPPTHNSAPYLSNKLQPTPPAASPKLNGTSSQSLSSGDKKAPVVPAKRLSTNTSPEPTKPVHTRLSSVSGTEPPPIPPKGNINSSSDGIQRSTSFTGPRPPAAAKYGSLRNGVAMNSSPPPAPNRFGSLRQSPSLANASTTGAGAPNTANSSGSVSPREMRSSASALSVSDPRLSTMLPTGSTRRPSNSPNAASVQIEPSEIQTQFDSSATNPVVTSSKTPVVIPNHSFDDETDRRRFYIVKEMVTTERSFVAGLDEGVNKMYKPLLEAAKAKSPSDIENVKILFSIMEHILPLNTNLLMNLEERVVNWSETQRIGDIFVKFAPFFKMYTTYSNNYDTALQSLTKMANETWFQEVIPNSHFVENIIITPIQRIPRYNLLLSDLVTNTSPTHVDYADISKALATVKDVAEHVNKGVGIYKNVARLTDAGLGHLLAPHRTLVRDGTVTVVVPEIDLKKKSKFALGGGDKEVKKQMWHFLLFSDTIVFVNQPLDENLLPKKDKKPALRLKIMDTKQRTRKENGWPLYLVWLKDAGLKTGFELIGPCMSLNMYFATSDEKNEWWDALEKHIKLNLEKMEQVDPENTASPATTQLVRTGKYTFTDVDSYDGDWHEGKIHGSGKMVCAGATFEGVFDGSYKTGSGQITYFSGQVYSGDWRLGRPHGLEGNMVYPSGEQFIGEFKDGKRNGSGTMHYQDGSTYQGEWKNDLPHGQGTLTLLSSNLKYTGGFSEGKFSGTGHLILPNASYEGSFEKNARSHRGKMTYSDGSIYEGEWKDDRRHGSGKYQCPSGLSYEGEWKNDMKDGRGWMKYANGDEYMGTWSSNKPHGTGTSTYKNGVLITKYDGEFKDGRRSGKGTAQYVSGNKYEGEWLEDLPHGSGKLTQSNGVVIDGKWHSGTIDPKSCVLTSSTASVQSTDNPESLVEPMYFPTYADPSTVPMFDFDNIVGFIQPP